MDNSKAAYVCGPLTELPPEIQRAAKRLYIRIADICGKVIGERGFVPHEHYDPVEHPFFSPQDVDRKERRQIYEKTSVLVVVAIASSWGGGIEVEMANTKGIPIIVLSEAGKRVSRLLLGNPSVVAHIVYDSQKNALSQLEEELLRLFPREAQQSS